MSFNQMTADQLSLAEAAALCAEAGIRWFGPVAPQGRGGRRRRGAADPRRPRPAGLLPVPRRLLPRRRTRRRTTGARSRRRRRSGPTCSCSSAGRPRARDVDGARARIARRDRAAAAPRRASTACGSAIEPLHPMMISERSAIVTLGEALDLAERLGSADDVGVIVDAYHVWWDPRLYEEIARAGRRILGYHVADWLVPTADRAPGPRDDGRRRDRAAPDPRGGRGGRLRRADRGRGHQPRGVGAARARSSSPPHATRSPPRPEPQRQRTNGPWRRTWRSSMS